VARDRYDTFFANRTSAITSFVLRGEQFESEISENFKD